MTARHRTLLLWLGVLVAIGCSTCAALRSRHQAASPSASNSTQTNSSTPSLSSSSATTLPATAPTGALLTVTITDVRNAKGDLIFGVFTRPDGFPNVQSKSVYWDVKPAASPFADSATGRVTFTTRLPPGRYAAGVLHDENRNGDMDKNLAGIPTEGYGVTNNPKPRFRKATFQEATFTLPPEGAELTIAVQYFLPG
jgi:uncharacterized protein (DUF2141 family)